MRVVAMIPARYGSTRFPGKMLADIAGKPLIVRTCENINATGFFNEVYVVTDSDEIQAAVEQSGGKVLRSIKEHDCGTDRIAEVAGSIDADIIINVQGDEPFLEKEPLEKLLNLFDDKQVQAASLVEPINDSKAINNPNKVKVVLTPDMYAIYFSRSQVPYLRDKNITHQYYKHIGIYAFRKEALLKFSSWQPTPLEKAEQLECNRFIENGMPIKMAVTDHVTVAVDTKEDIAAAEAWLNTNNK